jgi:hypothetical protein
MLKDGTYAAWFKTPLGQGTGIAHVADGKIWGRDSIMSDAKRLLQQYRRKAAVRRRR